jgi:hypothetical protein
LVRWIVAIAQTYLRATATTEQEQRTPDDLLSPRSTQQRKQQYSNKLLANSTSVLDDATDLADSPAISANASSPLLPRFIATDADLPNALAVSIDSLPSQPGTCTPRAPAPTVSRADAPIPKLKSRSISERKLWRIASSANVLQSAKSTQHKSLASGLIYRNKQVLAEQLTILESEIYASLQLCEFLDQSWNKPNKRDNAPTLVALADHFNKVASWVASDILHSYDQQKETHVAVYKDYIRLAKVCKHDALSQWCRSTNQHKRTDMRVGLCRKHWHSTTLVLLVQLLRV